MAGGAGKRYPHMTEFQISGSWEKGKRLWTERRQMVLQGLTGPPVQQNSKGLQCDEGAPERLSIDKHSCGTHALPSPLSLPTRGSGTYTHTSKETE